MIVKKYFGWIVIICMALSIIAIIQPTTVAISIDQNPGLPTVSISLEDTMKTAHVGPGNDCTVEFNGTVTVSMNPATTVVVSLAAEDTWGSAAVSPSELTFGSSGMQPFSVTVRARPRESTKTTGMVTVTGRWQLNPGGISGPANPPEGATGRIEIAQFYIFDMTSTRAFIETSLDSEVEFNLNILNQGNGADIFSISIINMDELNDKDITASLSMVSAEIMEHPAERPIELRVTTPRDSKCIGENAIEVSVTSDGGGIEQVIRFVVSIPAEEIFFTTEFSILLIIIILVIVLCIAFFWHRRRKRRRKS
jgi:hypothetical protein